MDISDLDRMVVIPDGDGNNPTIVTLGKVHSGGFLNRDHSKTFWARPDGHDGPLPDYLDKGVGYLFPDHATAVAWLTDHGLLAGASFKDFR
jgi:hypothetical protein